MKISRSIFIIIVLACISVTIVSQELRKVVTDVVKAGSQIWVKGTDVTTFFDNLSSNKTTSLSYGANSIDEDAIADNAIQNRHIEDMTIGWPETSLSLRDSIRNAKPTLDNQTIITKAGALSVSDTFNVLQDTSFFSSLNVTESKQVYLAKTSPTNKYGSGMFSAKDSASFVQQFGIASLIPGLCYSTNVPGKIFVRESIYGSSITFYDVGAIPDDSSSATGSHNTTVVQKLLDFSATGKVKAVVPGDVFWFNKVSGEDYCLRVEPGLSLEGYGVETGWAAGSTLAMRNGQNGTLLKQTTDGWLHSTQIKNITLMPNGFNNTTANGLYVIKLGENAEVSNVQVSGIRGYGMRFGNVTAHDRVFNITLNPATGASKDIVDKERIGIWLEKSGKRSFKDISGDNMSPMFYLHGAVTVKIDGLKIEGDYTSGWTKTAVIWCDSVPNANSFLKIENLHVSITDTLNTLVRVTGPNFFQPPIIFDLGFVFNADTLVASENLGNTVVNSYGRLIGFIPVAGAGGTTTRNVFHDLLDFQSSGLSYIRFADTNGNFQGLLRSLTNVLYIRAPENDIVFEDDDGIDLLNIDSSLINIYRPLILSGHVTMSEQTAPSSPASNKGVFYFQDDGSGNTLFLVKFANGDIDTLASSEIP